MRCSQSAVKGHGQGTSNSRAGYHRWDYSDWICGSKWNCTLRDEGQTHNKGSDTRFALAFSKAVAKEHGAESNGNWRNHTASHNSCHNTELTASQQAGTGYIGCLVHRATHIYRHHTAHNQANHNTGAGIHTLQGIDHPLVNAGYRRSNNKLHQKAHQEDT